MMKLVAAIHMIAILFGRSIFNLGGTTMFNTIDALKVRIHNLQMRDPVMNAKIINKLKRRVRAMENK